VRKKITVLFGLLLVTAIIVVAAYRYLLMQGSLGYVIIGFGNWALESSFFLFALALLLTYLVLFLLGQAIATTARIPGIMQQRSGEQRSRQSREALIAGLLETAEGNWEKAERNLIRHVADSGVPLIHYLTAARAAHSRGAVDQRDEYLKLARQTTPEAELAIELTRAELQLSHRQFDAAIDSLAQLHRINPGHAVILRLMHQAYTQMEDWEGLRRLLPKLHQGKVLMEAEIKLWETETYSALLKERAETRKPVELRKLWSEIPEHIRQMSGIQTEYYAAMIGAGVGDEVEESVRLALGRQWNETLLVLYGCIHLTDAAHQLREAEAWIGPHPYDAVLFRVLAKLAWRVQDWNKVRDYLKQSLALEPSVEANQLMGDLLFRENDPVAACHYYRNGMLFASDEVVAQIEQNPEGSMGADAPETSVP